MYKLSIKYGNVMKVIFFFFKHTILKIALIDFQFMIFYENYLLIVINKFFISLRKNEIFNTFASNKTLKWLPLRNCLSFSVFGILKVL